MMPTDKPSDRKKMKKLKRRLAGAPASDGTPAPTEAEKAADEAAKLATVAAGHAKLWAGLDGKSPFDWPEDARNLFQSGCTCSLWGRSVVDMNPDQRILFVAYVDMVASDLLGQCKGLAMAVEQVGAAKKGRKRLFGRGKKG